MNRRKLKEHHQSSGNDIPEDSFHRRRRTLSKNINAIRGPQRLYMKGIDDLLDNVDPIVLADHPENVKLWLPSDFPSTSRDERCAPGLPSIEYRLRFATATNALQDIRRSL